MKIAFRYLKSKKAHNAVNIISIISICGVVVTTAALVCVLSVFNGFKNVIQDRLANLDPQVAICPAKGKVMDDADSVITALSKIDGIEKAMPVLEDQALASYADYQMPVRLKGVPVNYHEINAIDSTIIDGSFVLKDDVSSFAVVGVGPAMNLRLRAGSLRMLQLYAPRRVGRVNIANPIDAFTSDSLFVSSIFQVQQNSYDQDLIFVPLDFARNLFDYESEASQIELKLRRGAREDAVMKQVSTVLGPNYATFQNLGATRQQITRIFVAEGWLITMLGAVLGVVLGLLLCLGQQTYGWLKLSAAPSQVIVNAYPVQVVWTDIVVVMLLVAAIGFVTSLVTITIMRRRLR